MASLESDLQRLSLVVEGMHAGIWDWDLSNEKQWWSPAFYELTGYTPGEFAPTFNTFKQQLLHPDDRHMMETAIADHLQNRNLYRLEIRIRLKNGAYQWFEISGKAQFNADGKPVRMCGAIIDISDKKQLQLQLKQQNEWLEEVCTMTKCGGWEADFSTQSFMWSKQVYDICEMPTGYKPTLADAVSLYTPASAAKLNQCIEVAIHSGKPWDEELQLVTGKNNTLWIRVLGKAVHDQSGKVTGLKGVIQDITAKKKVEETLWESETRWKYGLESTEDGLWDWNATTHEVYYSSHWKKMLGYKEEEIGTSITEWEKRVHPDDVAKCYADMQAYMRKEKPLYMNEHRVLCKDGTYKWILDRGKVIDWDAAGNPLRIIGTHSDITSRKQAEAVIKESEEKFHNLFSLSPIGMVLTDLETGKFIEMNRSFLESTGYGQDELQALSFSQITPPEYAYLDIEQINRLKAGVSFGPFEKEYIRKDGSRMQVILNGLPVINEEGRKQAWSFIQDISQRKAKEQEIQSLNEQLTESNAQKDKLMALLAHDLRSPMATIDGLLWVIIRELNGHLSQELLSMLTTTKERVNNTSTLIDELLYWSLSQADRITLNPVKLSLAEVADSVITNLQPQALSKGITFINQLPANFTLKADPQMLQLILRNLIANAIKFSHSGSQILITATSQAMMAKVGVRDYGVGIEAENQKKLLNRNINFTTPGTKGERGTGLGLNLCLDLAEKHGGKLILESELHKGSTFTLILPQEE
ncbi:PAS domain-containing protein [Rhodocytophaga rosea]|uniref:histidine kinase n=1 Tax=Rhodocytophaga rosea TaxID=2704465 RepID=A0A6C0GTE8_9BACT|nr:PAS domain-containing sensor histidine kinase [Rhodocytophaga rosea]QHT71296.1 PAS domain-containing protein [Rhodocytophaga rosea]